MLCFIDNIVRSAVLIINSCFFHAHLLREF